MRAPRSTKAAPVEKTAPEEPMTPNRSRGGSQRRNPEIEAAIGARIRAARVAAKMSQGALGAAVGVTFQQCQKYERGQDRVSASTLQGIAAALGVHPGSFFDSDTPTPSGSIPDVKTAMRIAERIQRVRDPVVVKRLLALVDALAGTEDNGAGHLNGGDEAP